MLRWHRAYTVPLACTPAHSPSSGPSPDWSKRSVGRGRSRDLTSEESASVQGGTNLPGQPTSLRPVGSLAVPLAVPAGTNRQEQRRHYVPHTGVRRLGPSRSDKSDIRQRLMPDFKVEILGDCVFGLCEAVPGLPEPWNPGVYPIIVSFSQIVLARRARLWRCRATIDTDSST